MKKPQSFYRARRGRSWPLAAMATLATLIVMVRIGQSWTPPSNTAAIALFAFCIGTAAYAAGASILFASHRPFRRRFRDRPIGAAPAQRPVMGHQPIAAPCITSSRSSSAATNPVISVIIPTFNRAHFIGDAIRSILRQSFTDFELLVIDDGSTDRTADVVGAIDDGRIRLIGHDRNHGIPAARNTGLEHARGRFIAWLDSDDISRPTRLEEQLRYLDRHPGIEMVGACAGKIRSDGGRQKGVRVPPLTPEAISAWLLFRSPFQQSSIMGRAATLKSFRYRDAFPVCEDLDVFIRIAGSHRSVNLPRVLVDRRIHEGQSIRTHNDAVADRSGALLAEPLARLGITPSPSDLKGHIALGKPWSAAEPYDADYVRWAEDWMLRLRAANGQRPCVDDQALALATGFFWLLTCKAALPAVGTGKAAGLMARSPLTRGLFDPAARSWLATAAHMKLGLG